MSLAPSPNHGERRGGVRPSLIVLHYTGMPTCAAARARLCDPLAEVSAHWLVSEAGEAEVLVPEALRAGLAGAGAWGGLTDINSHSIGIELANPGDRPFPEPQMAALEHLLAAVMARRDIPARGVSAHSDMAPSRKGDPGPGFRWRRLAYQLGGRPAVAAGVLAALRGTPDENASGSGLPPRDTPDIVSA